MKSYLIGYGFGQLWPQRSTDFDLMLLSSVLW